MTSDIYKSKQIKQKINLFYSFNYKNLLIITDHMKVCKLSLSQKNREFIRTIALYQSWLSYGNSTSIFITINSK